MAHMDVHERAPEPAHPDDAPRDPARSIRPPGWAAFVLLLAALALLVGCGTAGTSSSGSTSSGATSKLCQGVAKANQALSQLSTAGDNMTVGQVKAIQQKLTTALNALAKLPAGGGSALSNLKSANDQLTAAIGNLPDSASVSQAGPQLQNLKGKAAQAQTAVTRAGSTLHCTP